MDVSMKAGHMSKESLYGVCPVDRWKTRHQMDEDADSRLYIGHAAIYSYAGAEA